MRLFLLFLAPLVGCAGPSKPSPAPAARAERAPAPEPVAQTTEAAPSEAAAAKPAPKITTPPTCVVMADHALEIKQLDGEYPRSAQTVRRDYLAKDCSTKKFDDTTRLCIANASSRAELYVCRPEWSSQVTGKGTIYGTGAPPE